MSRYVVDASVAVKWLVTEAHSDAAIRLLDEAHTLLALLAPELIYAEAANALRVMCRRGDFSRDDYAEAVDVLRMGPLGVPAAMRDLAPAAARLAVDLGHPVYDCLYLALALQENAPMVTADQRFLATVQRHPYLADRVIFLGALPF